MLIYEQFQTFLQKMCTLFADEEKKAIILSSFLILASILFFSFMAFERHCSLHTVCCPLGHEINKRTYKNLYLYRADRNLETFQIILFSKQNHESVIIQAQFHYVNQSYFCQNRKMASFHINYYLHKRSSALNTPKLLKYVQLKARIPFIMQKYIER